ncbi:hypothetical protein ACHAQJ_002977 [Trichoderma viride]
MVRTLSSIGLLMSLNAITATASQLLAVQGPITGGIKGYPFSAYPGNISSIGYIEEEFFLSGDGIRYNVVGNLTSDGHWTLSYNSTAAYKTRILVRRLADPKKFNGDAIVEWINVSGGYDLTSGDLPGVYEGGYIWASIDAQAVGLEGNVGTNPQGLIQWDPVRYGTLNIPDDAISYDIASQAANILRTGDVTGGQIPEHVILVGASQSGSRVLGYINGVQPLNGSYDAIIPVISAGASSDFSPAPAHTSPTARSRTVFTKVRTDLEIPVFMLNSETESLYYAQSDIRQPNTQNFREWEVTGSSHANLACLIWLLPQQEVDGISSHLPDTTNVSTVSWQLTLDAIYRHVSLWIRDPTYSPPTFPHIEVAANSSGVMDYVRDDDGNAKGGIRLPDITVPVAGYNGFNNGLSGNTYPFSDSKLKVLYPTHGDYVDKVRAAAELSLSQKVILEYQSQNYTSAAEAANVPPQATRQ